MTSLFRYCDTFELRGQRFLPVALERIVTNEVNMSKKITTYRGFKQVLISIAVNQFGYDRDEITQKVYNDEYKEYYNDGWSPFCTLQLDEHNSL